MTKLTYPDWKGEVHLISTPTVEDMIQAWEQWAIEAKESTGQPVVTYISYAEYKRIRDSI